MGAERVTQLPPQTPALTLPPSRRPAVVAATPHGAAPWGCAAQNCGMCRNCICMHCMRCALRSQPASQPPAAWSRLTGLRHHACAPACAGAPPPAGAFGWVQHARNRETGEEVAVKFIELGPRFYQKYVEREIINHRLLAHPHIVGFKEVFVTHKVRWGQRWWGGVGTRRGRDPGQGFGVGWRATFPAGIVVWPGREAAPWRVRRPASRAMHRPRPTPPRRSHRPCLPCPALPCPAWRSTWRL